jgi:hypothetical protein
MTAGISDREGLIGAAKAIESAFDSWSSCLATTHFLFKMRSITKQRGLDRVDKFFRDALGMSWAR